MWSNAVRRATAVSYTHLDVYKRQLPAELERNYKIADDVLRYIVINLEEQKA